MSLLDPLEAARNARDEARRAARDAALAALRDAPDTDAVDAAWSRIAIQFESVVAQPSDMVSLRRTILEAAIRGRLGSPSSTLIESSPYSRVSR